MAGFNKADNRTKNQCAVRIVSKKSGDMLGWFHPVDDYARRVFGVKSTSEITAEQAELVLPSILGNERVEVRITDMHAEIEPVNPEDF